VIELKDLLAPVRNDGNLYSVKQFVQPNSPVVAAVASILAKADDPIWAAHLWVNRVAQYEHEIGDFWSYPDETVSAMAGDCDCTAILLASVLRNYLSPENVLVAVGEYEGGEPYKGHAWVEVNGRILESTKAPNGVVTQKYTPDFYFNDKLVYVRTEAWPGMIPVNNGVVVVNLSHRISVAVLR